MRAGRRTALRRTTAGAVLATTALVLSQVSSAAAPTTTDEPDQPTVSFGEIVALEARVTTQPEPVLGTDKRWHLVYELYLLNTAPIPQQLTLLEVLDARTNEVLLRYDSAESIRGILTTSGTGVDVLPPNVGGIAFLDLSADRRDALPRRIAHRFSSSLGQTSLSFRGALTPTSRREAVRISPPLVGPGYLNENGCCGPSDHTRAVLTIDGTRWLAQRFAQDWIRIDEQNRPYVGDWRVNENWHVFGDPVVSASRGRVLETLNSLPENTPPNTASNLTPYTALGNHVIVDMGDGRYALYAHLQPGSVPVKVGDRVRPGQLLGKVGNSGSSVAPHLHFHVTEAPPAAASNGAPYVFDRFRYVAFATNADEVNADEPASVAELVAAPRPARRTNQMPLKGDVVDFPGSREAVLTDAGR